MTHFWRDDAACTLPPDWELRERGLEQLAAEGHDVRRRTAAARIVAFHSLRPWEPPPRLRGISHTRRIEIEQCLARTGSVAATMRDLEVSYETCHALLEWMAA